MANESIRTRQVTEASDTIPTTRRFWPGLSLPGQFLLAGAGVMLAATLIVGTWVSSVIEKTVVQNSAVTAADFVENFIAPIGQELAHSDTLSVPATLALEEIFQRPTVRERVLSYKIWSPGGRIVYASNPAIIGQSFAPGEEFLAAMDGHVAASYEGLDSPESAAEAELDVPLLEVYMPVRETWTNTVIGVVEFYERAEALRQDLFRARLTSWLIVGATFLISGALLFGIVQAGGQTIRRQSEQLKSQLDLTRRISQQNADLKRRAVTASARATAKSERMLRQLGSDLHDGPAQYLSLAALRLDSALGDKPEQLALKEEIRTSLGQAMSEIRLLSRGLALPDLDTQTLGALVTRAVTAHRQKARAEIELTLTGDTDAPLGYAQKLCVYRFLQEALSNAARHAPAAVVTVRCTAERGLVEVSVADDGPGFDAASAPALRAEGGQGLMGLRDRVESIGGTLAVASAPGQGTELTIRLPSEEHEQA